MIDKAKKIENLEIEENTGSRADGKDPAAPRKKRGKAPFLIGGAAATAIAVALCAVMAVGAAHAADGHLVAARASMTAQASGAVEQDAMYRLYNPNSGEHFYTSSSAERDHLVGLGWRYEGVGWMAPWEGDAVYRLYNPNAGEHHYTLSAAERDHLVGLGWRYEGVGWRSAPADGVPLHRLYNPNAFANNHHYTTGTAERDHLVGLGWRSEGVSWYAVDAPVHEHNWVPVTETVTVVDQEAWDEPVYGRVSHFDCSKCGDVGHVNGGEHLESHVPERVSGGYFYVKEQVGTIHHDAVTHEETVTVGYRCSGCGAVK